MSASHALSAQDRQESKALVVVLSALQLGLVVLVWLLALLPVAVMALCASVVSAVRPVRSKAPTRAVVGS